jgi:hypothetical protein
MARGSCHCPQILKHFATVLFFGVGCTKTAEEPFFVPASMFNFSANHLLLLSRTEYRSCAVLVMRDDSTHRVYRLHDFSKSHILTPGQYYCVFGKVSSADKLYLVVESVQPDTKHKLDSNALAPVDGAAGMSIG